MKVGQTYASTSSHDDEEIEQLYEDVKLSMRKVHTPYTAIKGDFNAKVEIKQAGEQALGNYGIDSRNARAEMLAEFAERNWLPIVNTFFSKQATGTAPGKAIMEKKQMKQIPYSLPIQS